ncbi:hypothetical protein [Flavobacterium daemonense]|uniref:hypothetical protein n=1 Tax=Flavobacterium daemonense TaxID=1393049 RepID=UPI001186DCD1|nr:hypothetical protein [Flavobacterium daemonense]KAF2328214.1 hypothetical protein FND99_17870 [Flavobacterium daemonense]
MNQTEAPINNQEIKIIKRKVEKTKIFLFVFVSFIALWSWGMSNTDSLFSLFNIIVFVFVIITLIVLILFLKRLQTTRKDVESKIKIVSTFKVIDKYRESSRNSYNYIIVFDSKDIPKYEVTKSNYDLINITDSIEIEYSKFAFWILKIEHKGNDIENKYFIQ